MDYESEIQAIHAACNDVFGAKIDIAPRALQSLITSIRGLDVLGNTLAQHSDLECFRGVLASSPACSDVLLRQEGSFDELIQSKDQTVKVLQAPRLSDYIKLLSDIFVSRFPFRSGFHKAGENVRAMGQLTEMDLLLGCLQAGRRSILPNKTAKKILQAAGLYEDELPTPRGDRFLSNLENQLKFARKVDSSHEQQQLILSLDENDRIRLRLFGANTVGQIHEQISKIGTFVFRGGVLQPSPSLKLFSNDSIEELEDLMNSKSALENDYQRFFEQHPEFLQSLEYKKIHAHPILYKDDGSRLIPDFFLEQGNTGWHAIADLKRPGDNMVIRKRNRVYFSQWVHEAIAQLQYYKGWFESKKNREIFEQAQQLSTKVYRPKMVLIAGRNYNFADEIERMYLLSNQNQDLTLWTYDDVLERAKKYRAFADGRMP